MCLKNKIGGELKDNEITNEKYNTKLYNSKIHPKSDIIDKLAKQWHELSIKYNINYSLAWGTLIGYCRNTNYIPWDSDIDIWIGKEGVEKLVKMTESRFTNDKEKHIFEDNMRLVLHPYYYKENKEKHKYRFDVNGDLVTNQIDSYSFNGPIARLIYNDEFFLDIDLWCLKKKKELYKNNDNVSYFVSHERLINGKYMLGVYPSLEYSTNMPETIITKLNNNDVRVFKDKEFLKQVLISCYGTDFIIPDRREYQLK